MIAAATIIECDGTSYVQTYEQSRTTIDHAEWYRLRSYRGLPYHAVPNVSGPSQRHTVTGLDTPPIVEVYHAILELLQDDETPPDDPSGPPTTCEQFEPPCEAPNGETAHSLPSRGEDTIFLTWWLLMSEDSPVSQTIKDMTASLQYQDMQDMRQDVAMRAWQRATSAELRGRRATINGRAIVRLVEQWLARNGKAVKAAAVESPEAAIDAQNKLEEERAVKRLEAWRIEVATLRAMDSQKNPPQGIPLFT